MGVSRIGEQMRRQREALGLEPHAVAALARIPDQRLLELEAGGSPTVWELHSVAGALAVDPGALRVGDVDADPRRSSARFRAPDGGVHQLTAGDARALARVAEAARIHRFLRGLLAARPGRVEALREVKAIGAETVWKQGYSLGQHAREHLAPAHTAITSVQELLEKRGVLVVQIELDSTKIAGASLYEVDASPAILLNRRSKRAGSRLARRAVLAHELCHLLHDSTKQEDLLTVVSRPNDRSPTEQRANAFAPSFLAPAHWVERHTGMQDRDKVVQMARTWGLTFEGAVWHAKNLKHITPKTAKLLQEQPPDRVDADAFESRLPRVPPSRVGLELDVSSLADSALGDLAVRACEADLISVGRAGEILTLT